MIDRLLADLRLGGYGPRTLLDIGAHTGDFTRNFLRWFPDCRATLIEPNPFCEEELAKLPHERHGFAASSESGTAEIFLSKQWLQSTGSSLYRENSAYFSDELVLTREVEKVRLDDVFQGRRFDFVKIDTQGSEHDILVGGREVIGQADYILVEISLVDFNIGAPKAEAVFAQLDAMGFRCADVADFHRFEEIQDNRLLQMDFLFERRVRRPSQNYCYSPLHSHERLLEHLKAQKARTADFTVLQLGSSAPWAAEVADAAFDMRPGNPAPLQFAGDPNDPGAWEPVLKHVGRHGRFAYAICAHSLQDLANPAVALEMLPRVAEAGHVSAPSRYLESLRPEGPYRGLICSRWVLDTFGEQLVLAPKIPFLEHLALAGEGQWGARRERFEFQMHWRGAIAFSAVDGDVRRLDRSAVIDWYGQFFDRP